MDILKIGTAPVVHMRIGSEGLPVGARAVCRIHRPAAEVWSVLSDVERYASFLPMMHRARRTGDEVTCDLKFKIGFFAAGFQFVAVTTWEEEKWLQLRWLRGEPRAIQLRFELTPDGDGGSCEVSGDAEFDPQSVGFLAKYFLKHHPEIQHGVFAGVSLVLIDSLKRALLEGTRGRA